MQPEIHMLLSNQDHVHDIHCRCYKNAWPPLWLYYRIDNRFTRDIRPRIYDLVKVALASKFLFS
jgi:hypothetical protein